MGLDTENNNDVGTQPGDTDLTDAVFGSDDSGTGGTPAADDFADGYNGAFSSDDMRDDEPEADGNTDPAPEAAAPAKPEPVKIGRWTEDEIAEHFGKVSSLDRTAQTLSGHIGDIKRRLLEAGRRQITKQDMAKVSSEFGEEFADALVEDLNKLGLGGPAVVPKEVMDSIVTEHRAQIEEAIEQKIEYKAVLRRHKDANDYFVRSDADGKPLVGKHANAFHAWVATLPPERQQELASSWDRDVVAGAIGEFKEMQKKGATPGAAAPAAQPTPQPSAADRTSRLRRAAMPQGSGAAATPSQEDPFAAGYKAARSGG